MATDRLGEGTIRRLAAIQAAIKGKAMSGAMARSGLIVASEAQRRVTTGGASGLKVRTGRLRASIHHRLEEGGRNVRVIVNAKYGRIHEYGGTTKAHIIRPRVKKALAFGDGIVVKFVRHPGSKIPVRPYLRPALEAKREAVVATVRQVYIGPLTVGGVAS